MFCKYCGAPSETEVCPNCAAKQAQAQPQPQYQYQPQKPAGDPLQGVKKNLHFILVGIAALALVWGILNVFSIFFVSTKGGYVSAYKAASKTIFPVLPVYVGNLIFGLSCLGAAAIGALYFLKVFMKMPYYDQLLAKWMKFRPAFVMGALVAAGAVMQLVMYLYVPLIGVNWTTWLMLVLFAAIAVVDKFVLEEKKAPVQFETPMQ